MPISKERFAQGITSQQFIDQIEKNSERFEQNFAETPQIFTDEDRAFFKQHPVSIAAIAEDWCTDVVQFLPPIIKLAEEVPSITLRIFLRDQNLDLMDQYLKDGEFRSIPAFIIYDADWNELGHFNERPAEVTQEMAKETRRFALDNSDLEGINRTVDNMPPETYAAVRANSAKFRWDNMLRWNRIFLDEIKSIAGGAAVSA
jgi:hypothetical protein